MSAESRPIRLSPAGKFITIAIIVALAILLIQAAYGVMMPFIAAAITAYLFNPIIRGLHHRTRISRAFWILVLYVMIGALIYLLVRFVGPLITSQYSELRGQVPAIRSAIEYQVASHQVVDIAGVNVDIGSLEAPVLELVQELGRSLPDRVPHLFLTAIEALLLFITYLMVTFYFLLQADQITEGAYRLVPAPYRAEIRSLGRQIDAVLMGYVRGTLLLIPIMALCTYIVLIILGVQYAAIIAIATGCLEIIPLIGPWTAAGTAMAVAMFQSTTPFGWDHWLLAGVVGLSYFVLRMVEDNFIIPQVVGHAVKLHPVLVLFAILAGGAIGGAFGLLIAIPLVAVIQLLLRYLYRKLVDAPEPPIDTSPPQVKPVQSSATEKPAARPVASQSGLSAHHHRQPSES
ncbi:MAG TPA: AI-2E family transporter [Roseiflexaceae bacterium]|nr:AI-2E family transporter [Roseiflexaceae bacterium]